MTAAPIHMAGERLMLDPMGALFWPEQRLLVVSDLHLEKGSSLARRGMLLPPWDTHATLDRLTLLLRRWSPRTVVALGDSFHDAAGSGRLPATEQNRLRAMTTAHRFVWVRGNHDPAPPENLGGTSVDTHAAGPIVFRHEAIALADPGEVVGHHHPKATVQARAGSVSRPCFMFDGKRLMMPAFGAYTAALMCAIQRSTACSPAAGGCSCWARTACSVSRLTEVAGRGRADTVLVAGDTGRC